MLGVRRLSTAHSPRRGRPCSIDCASSLAPVRRLWVRNSSTSPANGQGKSTNTIFSGIQPTGAPHIGNYLGALQEWVKLQNEAPCDTKFFFSVVDLHAITMPQEAKALREQRKSTFAALVAIGLDPERCAIFFQSDVPQHSELMWILSCRASTGYLGRMTQWKSKSSLPENANISNLDAREKVKLGLFSYPVLQAADILVHRATHVPVGEDQAQHLEFARTLAGSFNHDYGEVLKQPTTLISPAKRVMSLRDPSEKMSKSNPNERSRISIIDNEDAIRDKVRYAVTDSMGAVSYDPVKRPGLANLIEIVYHLDPAGAPSVEERADQTFKGLSVSAFKHHAVEVILRRLNPIREKYQDVLQARGEGCLENVAATGASKAQDSADATLKDVRKAIGFA